MQGTLLELFYWPPISWLSLAWQSDILWIESCENFQKGSYRNRCHIAGPNGLQRLSIPLQKGKHQQTPVRDVRIAYQEPWRQVHWRSIQAAYGNAPYFEHYADEVQAFFEKKYTFLFDLNLDVLHFLLQKMGWNGNLNLTETYRAPGQATQDAAATDARGSVSPNPPFTANGYIGIPYPQVFLERHGFLPDLSSLDLLFCCGKQSAAATGISNIPAP